MKVEIRDKIKSIIETDLEYVIEETIFVAHVIGSTCTFSIRPKDEVDWFNHKQPNNIITHMCDINDPRILYDLKRLYLFTNKVGFYL